MMKVDDFHETLHAQHNTPHTTATTAATQHYIFCDIVSKHITS